MNYNLNLGLKGEYKVDIFSGKKLIETTDWFSNDITNWGLIYPLDYSFAKCFMFLSIGSGDYTKTPENPNNQKYTGLFKPIPRYRVIDKNGVFKYQSGQYIGWEGYEVGGEKDINYTKGAPTTCGTRITEKGIRMYRGWTIPTGTNVEQNVLAETLNIGQIMVSPSNSSNPKADKAFSIVDRPITIPSGFTATITYQLSLDFKNFNIPYTIFNGKPGPNTNGFFDTGNAITGVNGSDERELLSGWSNLSGIFRQIVPGFQAVDALGACFIPDKMGSDLEPSYTECKKTFFYLSPDFSQFAISKSGVYGGDYTSYNSNGLMFNYYEKAALENRTTFLNSNKEIGTSAYAGKSNQWFYSGVSELTAASDPDTEFSMNKNIHLENFIDISNYKTGKIEFNELNYRTRNYTGAKNFPVAFATPGRLGFDYSLSDFGQRFVSSTYLKRMPIDENVKSTGTRFKYVTKKAIIPPLYCYGHNSRYGSLTLGYNRGDNNTTTFLDVSPYIQFLFFDNDGRGANMSHYRYVPNLYLKDRGTGVARVKFDIISQNGSKPESINRFFSVYGFMGAGTNNVENSGIDINNKILTGILISGEENERRAIPSGIKTSGFLLKGQILNTGVKGGLIPVGSKGYNGLTGYGAVYGVVTNSGFHFSPFDLCLLDVPDWKGLGDYPYETGYTGNLCWPHYSKKISLRLSEMQYYDPEISGSGSNVINDSIDFFATGQVIKNILAPRDSEPNIYYSLTGFPGKVLVNNLNENQVNIEELQKTGGLIRIKDIQNNYINYDISFNSSNGTSGPAYIVPNSFNFSIYQRGYGYINFPAQVVGISGKKIDNSYTGILLKGSGNSSVYQITEYIVEPTSFKKPEAYIYHVESTGNDIGYRLLPNYAVANTGNINTYSPVTGGAFPGLSIENGMELYLTLTWSGA